MSRRKSMELGRQKIQLGGHTLPPASYKYTIVSRVQSDATTSTKLHIINKGRLNHEGTSDQSWLPVGRFPELTLVQQAFPNLFPRASDNITERGVSLRWRSYRGWIMPHRNICDQRLWEQRRACYFLEVAWLNQTLLGKRGWYLLELEFRIGEFLWDA